MNNTMSDALYVPTALNRVEFINLLVDFSQEDVDVILKAYAFAKQAHRGQWRRDGGRYFEHPKAVAAILLRLGVRDADTICAALLHDVVEDCQVTVNQIEKFFGRRVALCCGLLDKTGLSDDEYFAALANAEEPFVWEVKMADRLHNLSTLTDDPAKQEWCNRKKLEQVFETRTRVMPVASLLNACVGSLTGPWFQDQLVRMCAKRWAEVFPRA